MFTADELKKYARTLWWGLSTARTSPYKPGELILLRFDQPATPLAEAVFDLLMDEGMVPVARQNLTSSMELSGLYSHLPKSQMHMQTSSMLASQASQA